MTLKMKMLKKNRTWEIWKGIWDRQGTSIISMVERWCLKGLMHILTLCTLRLSTYSNFYLKSVLFTGPKNCYGKILSLLMKGMIIYFHALRCKNYANACFEHVAQTVFFLSERVREQVIHEVFANNQGKAMSLDIEHLVKFFKSHLTLQSEDSSRKLLDRLSKAQDKLQLVLENVDRQFAITRYISSKKAG